jgi:hypothetical protein
MKLSTRLLINAGFSVVLLVSQLFAGIAQADGLSDLKGALTRLQGKSHITAELESVTRSQRDEGDDAVIKKGQVTVWLKDNSQGLEVLYSDDVLAKMETEARLQAADEEAETVTLNAVDGINATELHSMLSASSTLSRNVEQAIFVDEITEMYEGKEARLLRFDLPMAFLINDKKLRSYVSKFEARYLVWIATDGTPLQSKIEFQGKGRAYIFFSIRASGSSYAKYQVVDERLVITRWEENVENDSTFGFFERSEVKILQVKQAISATASAGQQL